jgi:glycosyltransferase involved in cell wall biosynthesis
LALQLSSPSTAAAVCGIITRRPFLVMSSTSGPLSETSLMQGGARAAIRRQLVRRATSLIGQTDEAVHELRSLFPSTPASVVTNPVAAVDVAPLSGEPRVAFAGRLSQEKDLLRLLAAWESLVTERSDASLTLIGAGSAHRSVEQELRSEVERRPVLRRSVRFTGWLPDPTAELLTADVFVLPSLSEGMSNALLEACALGRVVAASDIAANVAVLGRDYPLLFRAGVEAEMLRALRTAFDDESVRARCRAQIAERLRLFSPDTVAQRLETLLLDADRARHQ